MAIINKWFGGEVLNLDVLNPFNAPGIMIFLVLMFLIFLVSMAAMTLSYYRARSGCYKVIKSIKGGKYDEDNPIISIQQLFNKNFYEEEFESYQTTLKYVENTYTEKDGKDDVLISSDSAHNYFNEEVSIIKSKMSLYNYIPHIFISIGIFGTFYGIVLGLGDLGAYLNEGTTESIRSGISILLDSVHISFRSSLYGIFFSVLFAFYFKFVLASISASTYKLSLNLNRIFSFTSESVQLQEIKNELTKQTISVQKLARDMADEVSKVIELSLTDLVKRQENTLQSMAQNVSKSIDGIGTESIKNITEPLENILEKVNTQYSHIESLLGTIQSYNTTFAKNVEVYDRLSKNVMEAMNQTGQSLDHVVHTTMGKIEQMQQISTEIREEDQKVITALTNALNGYQSQISQYIDQVTRNVEDYDAYLDQIEKTIIQSKDYVQHIHDSQSGTLEVFKVQSEHAQLIQKDVHENLKKYNQEVNNGLVNIFKNYDNNASKILGNIKEVVDGFSESVETITYSLLNLEEKLIASGQNDDEQVKESLAYDQA